MNKLFSAIILSIVLCLTATPMAIAGAAGFNSAKIFHDRARDGENNAAEKAVDAFTVLVKAEPKNALALAYLGSSYAISARDANVVTNKIRYTNRGLRYLDQAVSLEPENFVVLVIRANVTASLPSMFGRGDTSLEDMLLLDKLFSQSPNPDHAKPMVGIYSKLADIVPDQNDWDAKSELAKGLLAGN